MSYEERAKKMDEAARKAMDEFLQRAKGRARRALKALPSANLYSGYAGEEPNKLIERIAYLQPDIPSAVDRIEDFLEEKFGLSPSEAEGVAEWHRDVVGEEADREKSAQLNRIAALLIRRQNDLPAVIYGLALAAQLTDLNGLKSGADVARSLGKHRATLSYWKRTWQKLLGLKNETYGKSDVSKEKYRQRRKENVAQWKKRISEIRKKHYE